MYISESWHRQLIGYVGLVLPFLLVFIVLSRDGVAIWQTLDSISAYYYTGAVTAFAGMLIALALFLFTYRGYQNDKYNWADLLAAKIAAVASLLVAYYPTAAPDEELGLYWWTQWMGIVHHGAAIVLFAMFAVFSLWLFRLTGGLAPSLDKKFRNNIYLICGLLIVGCMLWAGYNAWNGSPIFWPESVALIAFAISWLVKGYAVGSIVRAAALLRQKIEKGKL
jgi:hypothetical protein